MVKTVVEALKREMLINRIGVKDLRYGWVPVSNRRDGQRSKEDRERKYQRKILETNPKLRPQPREVK